MKRSIIIVLCFVFFASICFASPLIPQPGLYNGSFISPEIDNIQQCVAEQLPGYVRIKLLSGPNIQYDNILLWNGIEIVLLSMICELAGPTMHCPCTTQILNLNPWGFDAIVTNKTNHGIALWLDSDSFVEHLSVRKLTCEGTDCEEAAIWMFGTGACFPCNIGPYGVYRELIAE